MILDQETYEKYGYHLYELSRGSKKFILFQCNMCNKIYQLKYIIALNKKTEY